MLPFDIYGTNDGFTTTQTEGPSTPYAYSDTDDMGKMLKTKHPTKSICLEGYVRIKAILDI